LETTIGLYESVEKSATPFAIMLVMFLGEE